MRGKRIELEELEDTLAIKVTDSTQTSVRSLGQEFRESQTVQELERSELAAFQQAGWRFIASSDEVRSSLGGERSVRRIEKSARVYQQADQRLLVGTDELIVQLKDSLDESEAKAILSDLGLEIVQEFKFGKNLFQVTVPPGQDSFDLAVSLYDSEPFIAAEPQFVEMISGRFVPTDPQYDQQWQWDNVEAEAAWDMTRGSGMTVAVIDNGFDVDHADLSTALTNESGYFTDGGFQQNTGNSYPSRNHGTFCAGLAAGRANNSNCGCGAANQAALTLVACLSDQVGTQATLGRAVAYAADPSMEVEGADPARGADVISCSLGPNGADWTMQTVLQNAIDFAVNSGRGGLGTPIFWAVTNGNFTIDGDDGTDEVCAYPNTIAVGRSRSTDIQDGSGYGPELDFLATGVDVLSTNQGGGCGTGTGTSYAAPCAAGIATLVLAVNNTFSWTELRNLMRETCDKVGGVNFGADNRHDRYGFGRVNARRAVEAAFFILKSQMQE